VYSCDLFLRACLALLSHSTTRPTAEQYYRLKFENNEFNTSFRVDVRKYTFCFSNRIVDKNGTLFLNVIVTLQMSGPEGCILKVSIYSAMQTLYKSRTTRSRLHVHLS